jgi:hypothetical protein
MADEGPTSARRSPAPNNWMAYSSTAEAVCFVFDGSAGCGGPPATATVVPSGLKATAAASVWCWRMVLRGVSGAASQSRTVVSPAEASMVPSGLKATSSIEASWPVSGAVRSRRWATSHSRTVLSSPPEASTVPSGLKARLRTWPLWPVSGAPDGRRWATSHNRTVLSSLADASSAPSGLKATSVTGPRWPHSGRPTW